MKRFYYVVVIGINEVSQIIQYEHYAINMAKYFPNSRVFEFPSREKAKQFLASKKNEPKFNKKHISKKMHKMFKYQSENGKYQNETKIDRYLTSGEIRVAYKLAHLNLKYKVQIPIKINGFEHIFDFAIYSNSTIIGFIEFDGVQHSRAVSEFGGDEAFNKQLYKDIKKDEYCTNNNLEILRISYLDSNEKIEKLILKKFGKYAESIKKIKVEFI